MAVAAIETDEDRSNAPIGRSTLARRTIDAVRTVDAQAHWASREEALGAREAEFPGTGNGQSLPKLTELRQKTSIIPRVVKLPGVPKEQTRAMTFFARQEWEGYVVAINGNEFTARLVDLTGGGTYEDEEAEIPLEEVSDADVPKMQVGSIFRWVIGVRRSPMGQKERVSFIVFRDLPAMSRSDEQAGKTWAKKILASFEE